MFPFNSLALFPQLSLLWRCHLWYLLPLLPWLSLLWRCHLWYYYSLSNFMYHCQHYTWFHSAPHHFLCPQICVLPLEHEAPPSSTLFFLLKALLGESVTTFFLFSNVVYISSLILFTLASGLYGLSFGCTNKYSNIFANTKAD